VSKRILCHPCKFEVRFQVYVRIFFKCLKERMKNNSKPLQYICHNPSLGLTTKARVYKGAGQDWAWESHFMFLGVQKSEGMNLDTPKWAPTLGVGVLIDSWIFRGPSQGSKTHWIKEFLISLKNSWNLDVWNGFAWPIWTLKHKL